jgi:hypothetical protein
MKDCTSTAGYLYIKQFIDWSSWALFEYDCYSADQQNQCAYGTVFSLHLSQSNFHVLFTK